jgi:transcriptional regulator with XRE-family HTH domain
MSTIIRLKIGQIIKEIRKKRGYTQEKLAELASIDYKYLQKIEGKSPPALKVDTIDRLAKALKISAAKLFDFK